MKPVRLLFLAGMLAGPCDAPAPPLEAGAHEEAVRRFRRSLEIDPDSYEARLGLAQALEGTGRLDDAVAAYGQAIALKPRVAAPRIGRARLLARTSRFEEAFKDLDRVTALHPKDPQGWIAQGDARLWNGQPDLAAAAYTRVLDLDPNDATARIGRGRAYAQGKQYPKALEDLSKASSAHPRNPEVWRALGDVRFWMGDPRKAEEAYARLLLLAPKDPEALAARAKARSAAGASPDRPALGAFGFEQLDKGVDATSQAARPWELRASAAVMSFSHDRTDWHEQKVSVRRSWGRGSLALEALRVRRFDLWDEAFALDGYVPLWSRAYANLRLQVAADPSVLPDTDFLIEPFQGFGEGWEASLFYRRMDFPEEQVDLYGGSLAKYLGNWYFRERVTLAPSMGSTQVSHAVLARRYLGTSGSSVEVEAGAGRSLVIVGPDLEPERRKSSFFAFRVRKHLTEHVGLVASLDYQDNEGEPVGRGGSLELVIRW